MSAASPGVVSLFFRNNYYPSQEAYLFAIAEAMRQEYEAVANAGIVLQIDCPDLAMGRHIQYAELSLADFRKRAGMHVQALNHALANIAPERLRMHLCWGNYEGPHHCDVALADIIDIVFAARPSAISFEAANPRHGHEWTLFEDVKLPAGKVLIPGVIESKTNFIEHPELIASASGATRARRPRERHHRQRLRLRHVGRTGRGRSRCGLGEARGDGGRRADRVTAVLALTVFAALRRRQRASIPSRTERKRG
jgi:5-methyltetrahydropteroyltriglutamate--homocysteine methyltransferase